MFLEFVNRGRQVRIISLPLYSLSRSHFLNSFNLEGFFQPPLRSRYTWLTTGSRRPGYHHTSLHSHNCPLTHEARHCSVTFFPNTSTTTAPESPSLPQRAVESPREPQRVPEPQRGPESPIKHLESCKKPQRAPGSPRGRASPREPQRQQKTPESPIEPQRAPPESPRETHRSPQEPLSAPELNRESQTTRESL